MAGSTAGFYSAFELRAALAGAPARDDLLRSWVVAWGRVELRLAGVDALALGPHIGAGEAYPGSTMGAAPGQAGLRPQTPGKNEQGKGRLFVMNHRSALDILVSFAHLEARILSRGDIGRWPVLGFLAARIGTLFVDRENAVSGARVAGAMVRAVEAGRGVLVFPEGTTYSGDEVRPFRPGAFVVSKRTGAEIIPIGIAYEGDQATFGDETFPQHVQRVGGIPRTRCALVAGDPIAPGDRDPPAIQAEAHAAVQALVHKARAALRG